MSIIKSSVNYLWIAALVAGGCTLPSEGDDPIANTDENKSGVVALNLALVCPPGFTAASNGINRERAEIVDGKLKLSVSHAAGCGDHVFTACLLGEDTAGAGNQGEVIYERPNEAELEPDFVADIAIQHQTDNVCEAMGLTNLEIDLSRLATYARSGKNGLNAEGGGVSFEGEEVLVEVEGFDERLVLPFSISAPQPREQEFIVAAESATWMSEIDSGPVYTEVRNSTTRTPTKSSVRASFGIDDAFAIKAFSLAKTRAEFTSLGEFDLAWRDVQAFMIKHTGTSYRLFKIGPADAAGKLIEDQGFYTYLVVGKAIGNSRALVGFFVRSVET